MNFLITSLISIIMGTVLISGGAGITDELVIDEILNDAKIVVNQANVHQIATVLELYHLNNDEYPNVANAEELIDLLQEENYIRNRPLDTSVFDYRTSANGQQYKFTVK